MLKHYNTYGRHEHMSIEDREEVLHKHMFAIVSSIHFHHCRHMVKIGRSLVMLSWLAQGHKRTLTCGDAPRVLTQ